MFKKILLIMSVCLLFAAGIFAQDDTASAKTDKPEVKTTTSDAPKTATRFVPNKEQIKQGQALLKEKKLYDGEASGTYNDETRAAIRVYQKENGLTLSGNFNRATLEKMNIALTDKQKGSGSSSGTTSTSSATTTKTTASTSPATSTSSTSEGPKRPAPFQATKEQITALQAKLKEAKLFSGAADGERSDDLKEAVKKYQEANDLKATGGINAVTLEKAGIALTDKQKANVAAQKAYDAAKEKE